MTTTDARAASHTMVGTGVVLRKRPSPSVHDEWTRARESRRGIHAAASRRTRERPRRNSYQVRGGHLTRKTERGLIVQPVLIIFYNIQWALVHSARVKTLMAFCIQRHSADLPFSLRATRAAPSLLHALGVHNICYTGLSGFESDLGRPCMPARWTGDLSQLDTPYTVHGSAFSWGT